ncbi:MAG TPA: hypothetical protein VHC67_01670 [Gaiellaceae bacterium]|jgi:hypothetical protein|nr:hypothetical protein [Gaiellaceae bacterium]
MRRSLTIAAVLAVGVGGAGGAFAATRGHDEHAFRPPKLLPGAPPQHVCHPGVKGSRLDARS